MTMPLPTMIDDEGLRRNLVISAGLHLAIILFLYFGLPHFYTPLPEPSAPVPFEIVTLADITNTRLKKLEEAKPLPPPKPEKKAYAPPTPPTPPQPPQKTETKPADQIEALSPKPLSKPAPPKPAVKPKPQQDFLASVLKDVSQIKPATPSQAADKDSKSQTPSTAAANTAPSLSDRLTISEEDALRRQIEQYWSPPIGARDMNKLVVEVQITVNPDRTVATANVVDQSRMAADPFFRAAAESALRALDRFRYQPLELPDGKYAQWKSIDFTFDPRDL